MIDLMDVFCPCSICGFEARDGTLLYRDMHSHPSVEGSWLDAPRIRQALLAGGGAGQPDVDR